MKKARSFAVFFLLSLACPLFVSTAFADSTITLESIHGKIVLVDSSDNRPASFTPEPQARYGLTHLAGKPVFWLQAAPEEKNSVPLSVATASRAPFEASNPVINPLATPLQQTEQNRKEFITSAPTQNMDEPVQESPVTQPEPEIAPEPQPEPTPEPVLPPDDPPVDPLIPPVTITQPPPVNHTPTVQNVTFNTNEDGELRETLSGTDEDNNQLTFSQVNANPLHGTLTINPNGTFQYVPHLNYFGIDTFQYKANDGSTDSNIGVVTISILPVNDLPLSNAGIDQTVASGNLVTLDGSDSSDQEGSELTYQWIQSEGDEVTLNYSNTSNPTFTAPTGPTTLVFNLQVTDEEGGTSQNSVIITVEAPISQGTTYYIDQYHPSASDSNAGTSEDQPWKTINSDLINALSPGDTVLIKGDASGVGVYTGRASPMVAIFGISVGDSIVIGISNLHGEPGAEITIKNYPGHKITIDGQDSQGSGTSGSNILRIDDSSYIQIKGLRFIHSYDPFSRLISMYHTSHCLIEDVYVEGAGVGRGVGINLLGGNQNTIRHSTITKHSYAIFSSDSNSTIEENHIYKNTFGIHTGAGSRYSILRRNVSHHNSLYDVSIFGSSDGSLIDGNILYNAKYGIYLTQNVTVSSGNVIRNNITFDISGTEPSIGAFNEGVAYYLANAPGYIGSYPDLFYHNISAHKGLSSDFHFYMSGDSSVTLRNNIAIGQGRVALSASLDSNFNLWDDMILNRPSPSDEPNSILGSAEFANIGLLDIDDNNDGTPDVFDSLNDPEANFPDTESAVDYARQKAKEIFSLTPTSQAINKGTPITYTDPVTGNPVSIPYNGSAPDIGAFES